MRVLSFFYPILIILWILPSAFAQSDLSRLALMNLIPQNTQLHPTYTPPGKVFLGLPVLSQVSVYANNRFSAHQAIEMSIEEVLEIVKEKNKALGNLQLADFYLGMQLPNNHYFSFFGNERIHIAAHYPKGTFNTAMALQDLQRFDIFKLNANGLQANALVYREIGINYSLPIKTRLRIGVAAKYLQGMASLSMQRPMHISLNRFRESQVAARMAGALPVVDIPGRLKNELSQQQVIDYLRSNHNRGFVLDVGAHYQVNYFLQIASTLRNLGYIRFQDYLRRYRLQTDALDQEKLIQAFLDKQPLMLDANDLISEDLSQRAFTQWMPAEWLTTATIQMTDHNYLALSNFFQYASRRLYSYQVLNLTTQLLPYFAAAASVVRYPQHIRFGGAFVFNFGPIQLYTASGDILSLLAPKNAPLVDLNVGLNWITGRTYPKPFRVYCPSRI